MFRSRAGDPIIILIVLLLFSIGAMVLYTTTPIGSKVTSWIDTLFVRQLLFGLLSVVIILVLQRIDMQFTRTLIMQVLFVIVLVALLGGLFLFGPVINDTHRWYHFGQFLLQPSEFLKIVVVLWSAYWLTASEKFNARHLITMLIGLAIPMGLVVLQPDFGATVIMVIIISSVIISWVVKYQVGRELAFWAISTIVIVAVAAATSLWVNLLVIAPLIWIMKKNWQIGIVALGLLVVVGGVGATFTYMWQHEIGFLSKEYHVRKRLDSFIGASEMTSQIRQSRIAIGSGGVWGKGLAQGTQTRLRFLPEYTTDFIFATFAEERGFAGIMLLFVIYITFFARLVMLALQVKDEYARLVITGLIVKLWFETFMNIGMNMGVLPTKGVALPFVSYGGSSLLANSLILGIILSLYRYEAKHDTMSSSYGLA